MASNLQWRHLNHLSRKKSAITVNKRLELKLCIFRKNNSINKIIWAVLSLCWYLSEVSSMSSKVNQRWPAGAHYQRRSRLNAIAQKTARIQGQVKIKHITILNSEHCADKSCSCQSNRLVLPAAAMNRDANLVLGNLKVQNRTHGWMLRLL
jgi:hypothetical protein